MAGLESRLSSTLYCHSQVGHSVLYVLMQKPLFVKPSCTKLTLLCKGSLEEQTIQMQLNQCSTPC